MNEALAAATAQGLGNVKALNVADCPPLLDEGQADDRCTKPFATLQARLALRGFTLCELGGGGYLVSRWDRTAHLNDLRGVREFLHRVGGHHG